MKEYKHLSSSQRYALFVLLQFNVAQKDIANLLQVSPSTISREIHRNSDKRDGRYKYEQAQRKAENRKTGKKQPWSKIQRCKHLVETLLQEQWSPEQITGRMRLEGVDIVSHETIYQYVWTNKRQGGTLYLNLRHRGKHYHKRSNKYKYRGSIPNRIDISKRPQIVEERTRFGDLEIDTMIGKDHKGALLTINDRASSLAWIMRLEGKSAIPLTNSTIATLKPIKELLHTITADNGREFTNHADIAEALDVGVYFAKPYHSWERGANENMNGLIRQYIPKKTDFKELTEEYVAWVQNQLNNRPRKRLGWLTPIEKFELLTKKCYNCT